MFNFDKQHTQNFHLPAVPGVIVKNNILNIVSGHKPIMHNLDPFLLVVDLLNLSYK